MPALLLDTCAVLWVMNGEGISDQSRQAIEAAAASDRLFVSPVSAWEIATLVRKGRITLSMAPESWFDAMLSHAGVRLAATPPGTLIASTSLPGDPPADPADRIILATARTENLVLVTRDKKLLSYAAAGHVRALEC
jgi:PIN domain nuclease of toxin-antitoxin system